MELLNLTPDSLAALDPRPSPRGKGEIAYTALRRTLRVHLRKTAIGEDYA